MTTCPSCQSEVIQTARFCPNCGGSVPVTRQEEGGDPLLGKVIARNFRVESLLGTGGMGRVYKARQLSLDKPVVLKILHPHFNDDPQLVQRFHREARAASRLNHPNSISIIDFGQSDDGTLFMAMELLHGRDLFTVLQNEFPLSEERLGRIMVQVCSALAEAHEQNIIHRDIKPENIMVEDRRDHKDYVKVLDFGIAKIQDPGAEDGRALTQQGMVCGTPEYMSPEQARGETLDARSDLYALGVLMFQMVTGDLPFKAETAVGIVTKHITQAPTPPRQTRPDLTISPEVEAIILKCMEKAPDRRFQTAMELGAAWKRLLEAPRAPVAAAVVEAPRRATVRLGASEPLPANFPPPAEVLPTPGGTSQPATQPELAKSSPAAPPVAAPPVIPLPALEDIPLPAEPTPPRRPLGLWLGAVGGALVVGAVGAYFFAASGPGPGVPNTSPADPRPAASGPAADPAPASGPAAMAASSASAPAAASAPAPAASAEPAPVAPSAATAAESRSTDKPRGKGEREERHGSAAPPRPEPAATEGDADPSARAAAVRELVQRADKRMQVSDYEEAIKDLMKARKVAPKDANVARLLGDALMANGDLAAACPHWREFLKLAPRDAKAAGVRSKLKGGGCDD